MDTTYVYKTPTNRLYNYPSSDKDSIINNNQDAKNEFNHISNDYTTISAYDFTMGSFMGHYYRYILKTITNIDIYNVVTPEENTIIYNKISDLIVEVLKEDRQKFYRRKYPYYKNYPVHLNEYYNNLESLDEEEMKKYKVDPYYLSASELFFMKKLFYIYSKYKFYLIPKIE